MRNWRYVDNTGRGNAGGIFCYELVRISTNFWGRIQEAEDRIQDIRRGGIFPTYIGTQLSTREI